MNALAIDTSSVACTVALQLGKDIVERHEEQPREHTRLLLPMIRDVLHSADASLSELDAIVLGNGPGSFIGMRIATSVAQGLAYGSGLKIIPVSSLATLAAEVFDVLDAAQVAVTQDAHMHEVYLGLFARGANDRPVEIVPERLHSQSKIEELDVSERDSRVTAGCGWQRYPALRTVNEPVVSADSGVLYPRARYLLGLGRLEDAVDPRDIQPAYLREHVATPPSTATRY